MASETQFAAARNVLGACFLIVAILGPWAWLLNGQGEALANVLVVNAAVFLGTTMLCHLIVESRRGESRT